MNDWIEWHGGECPVDGEANVEIRFRQDKKNIEMTCKAADCEWQYDPEWYHDIIAYRVVEPCATAPATS